MGWGAVLGDWLAGWVGQEGSVGWRRRLVTRLPHAAPAAPAAPRQGKMREYMQRQTSGYENWAATVTDKVRGSLT